MSDDCLHCKINKLVEEHVENVDQVDVAELAAKMAESLAELILFGAPPDQHATLLAYTMAHLGEMFVEKAGAGEGDTTH
jgi:hypothetical protein